ncbi:MAG: toll/interleukin-1 receptor domain-containing protein [Myxococcota bacterium]
MIFVSYRRYDAEMLVGRLYGHLEHHFQPAKLMMDAHLVRPGVDFIEKLQTDVRRIDVMLVMIGPHWIDAKDRQGRRMIELDNDHVRIELATALRHRKVIIPVLLDEGEAPTSADLPAAVRGLSRLSPLELRRRRFRSDARELVRVIKESLQETEAARVPTLMNVVPQSISKVPPLKPSSALTTRQNRPDTKETERIATSHALLVVGHDTVIDVVRKRHGSKLMRAQDKASDLSQKK